jgi:hypothetical protein
MSKSVRDNYIQYRTDPANDEKALSHFCTKYGHTLDEARGMLSTAKNLEKDILEARRAKYASRMQKIDDALIEAAEGGDTKAADLVYRRFDGWNPKIVEETNNFYNFAEIAKRVAKQEKPTRTVIKRTLPDDGET